MRSPAAPRGWSVSIHAPARGATSGETGLCLNLMGFDPRPRTGGDGAYPARMESCSRFDPRPRTGGDRLAGDCLALPQFRSTPPHGGRLPQVWVHVSPWQFRSTPPHGGRPLCARRGNRRGAVSIHAPARGATGRRFRRPRTHRRFDPRPRTGGDDRPGLRRRSVRVSIHAPARGATNTVLERYM